MSLRVAYGRSRTLGPMGPMIAQVGRTAIEYCRTWWRRSVIRQRIVLVGGGTRSGKSRFALALAGQHGPRRLFLATGQPGDDEMSERIRRHRQERGTDFVTIEEPLAVPEVV